MEEIELGVGALSLIRTIIILKIKREEHHTQATGRNNDTVAGFGKKNNRTMEKRADSPPIISSVLVNLAI